MGIPSFRDFATRTGMALIRSSNQEDKIPDQTWDIEEILIFVDHFNPKNIMTIDNFTLIPLTAWNLANLKFFYPWRYLVHPILMNKTALVPR